MEYGFSTRDFDPGKDLESAVIPNVFPIAINKKSGGSDFWNRRFFILQVG